MKYFIDTEFIENGKTIDLVSIGIVCEDGREYYAQSSEFDDIDASPWVLDNVLEQLKVCVPGGYYANDRHYHKKYEACYSNNTACPWRTREQIKQEVLAFMDIKKYGTPELWGYYSAYDHVAFCQLFGTMMDLPKGFPMYTKDLKQWGDELGNPKLPEQEVSEHHALADARWNRLIWQFLDEEENKPLDLVMPPISTRRVTFNVTHMGRGEPLDFFDE